jgi:hypothetical protein
LTVRRIEARGRQVSVRFVNGVTGVTEMHAVRVATDLVFVRWQVPC